MKKIATLFIFFVSISNFVFAQTKESFDILMEARKSNFTSLTTEKVKDDMENSRIFYKCAATIKGLLGSKSSIIAMKDSSIFYAEFRTATYDNDAKMEVGSISIKLLQYAMALDKTGNYKTETDALENGDTTLAVFDLQEKSVFDMVYHKEKQITIVRFYGVNKTH